MAKTPSSSSVAADPPNALIFGPPLGVTDWEGIFCKNHCQVYVGRRMVGMLFLLSYPEIEVENVIIPLNESYRFQPLDDVPLPMLVSSSRQSLVKDLQHYVGLHYPADSTDAAA